MSKILTIFLALIFSTNMVFSDDLPAYKLYDSDGDEIDYEDLTGQAADADIIFFGELHNDPICHWLEFELTKSVYKTAGDNLILGAEMIESDDQLKVNEYLEGFISQRSFEEEARLWKNYKTDYKPLVEFANDNKLNFIATNVPRRYAALVASRGFEALDSLSSEAKAYFAPLPIKVDLNLACYKNMEKMMMSHPMTSMKGKGTPPPMSEIEAKMKRFKEAQAIKDATMSHFILSNYTPGKKFIHYNGSYHSDNHQGITWFIKRDAPSVKMLTIASIEKDDISSISDEERQLADIILVVQSSMTKTN